SQIQKETHHPSVKLMTLHNSKGLEFTLVFLSGLEEDLLPHINAKDNPTALEEERRLCYVGMTRARQHLYLCRTIYRFMWGTTRFMHPSRFIDEIPIQYIDNLSPSIAQDGTKQSFSTGDQVRHQQFGEGI